MLTLDRKLVRDLWRTRSQAAAIALVVGAGVAMFVLMLSAFASLDLTKSDYYARQRFADVFASLTRAPIPLAGDIARLPGVAASDTRVVADVTLDVPGDAMPIAGRLVSVPDVGRPALNDLVLRAGRWVEPYADDEAIVSEPFAAANHLRAGDAIGALINGRHRDLRIVGLALSPEYVYAIRPGELIVDVAHFGILWMSRKALGTAFQMDDAFNDVSLQLAHGASEPEVIARLDRLLDPYGGLGAIPRSQQLSNFFLQGEIDSLRGMGRIVPAIFLSVAAFLLNVVLTRLVAVERQQIGALKALGYSSAEIGWWYVKWALAVAIGGVAIGTAAGAAMGRGLTALYTDFFNFPDLHYVLPMPVAIGGASVAMLAAVIGALGATRRVVRLPPAEAMRPAPSASYRVTWLERAGARRWLSQPTRIVLRNIQRHPWRTTCSAAGIALGTAMLIVGTFTTDAMQQMIDTQFDVAQRYDAMVTVTEPASADAMNEIDRLPGVLRAEPFRAVPARLRSGPRSRSVAITGLAPDATLNRVVSGADRIVTLPSQGLVLSHKLASLLDVSAGDMVTVDVLEGRRPNVRVPVERLTDDYLGTNAYMNLAALHALMHEGDSVSGAYLEVDASRLDELYRRLKQTPRVAGVGLRRTAIDSFNDTLAESVGLTRTITVLFAAIIAFGVVYNTARVALSERGWELATLRVIGFTRGEIAYVLLGELALVTSAALPLGALAGYAFAAATVIAFDTDVYRLPLIVTPRTYALAIATTIAAAAVSAAIVRRSLQRMDLIGALKTRE
ncbi:MAG TPA: FtsX-like permease family protein [Vicinamibacterales bacterium]|nr:FtsX-like permease family protein [Vicinamibacterales bacterium]